MRQQIRHRLTAIAVIFPIVLLLSCTNRQNWTQFRGNDGSMVVASASLPEKWNNDTNVIWITALDGAGYSSPIVCGDKLFITTTIPEKVNPAPERGPMQGPPPQGGQVPQPGQGMPQPGQGPQPGLAAPQPEIPDTSFKKEIYRWEVKCFDLKTGKELWKQVPYRGAPKAGKNPGST